MHLFGTIVALSMCLSDLFLIVFGQQWRSVVYKVTVAISFNF